MESALGRAKQKESQKQAALTDHQGQATKTDSARETLNRSLLPQQEKSEEFDEAFIDQNLSSTHEEDMAILELSQITSEDRERRQNGNSSPDEAKQPIEILDTETEPSKPDESVQDGSDDATAAMTSSQQCAKASDKNSVCTIKSQTLKNGEAERPAAECKRLTSESMHTNEDGCGSFSLTTEQNLIGNLLTPDEMENSNSGIQGLGEQFPVDVQTDARLCIQTNFSDDHDKQITSPYSSDPLHAVQDYETREVGQPMEEFAGAYSNLGVEAKRYAADDELSRTDLAVTNAANMVDTIRKCSQSDEREPMMIAFESNIAQASRSSVQKENSLIHTAVEVSNFNDANLRSSDSVVSKNSASVYKSCGYNSQNQSNSVRADCQGGNDSMNTSNRKSFTSAPRIAEENNSHQSNESQQQLSVQKQRSKSMKMKNVPGGNQGGRRTFQTFFANIFGTRRPADANKASDKLQVKVDDRGDGFSQDFNGVGKGAATPREAARRSRLSSWLGDAAEGDEAELEAANPESKELSGLALDSLNEDSDGEQAKLGPPDVQYVENDFVAEQNYVRDASSSAKFANEEQITSKPEEIVINATLDTRMSCRSHNLQPVSADSVWPHEVQNRISADRVFFNPQYPLTAQDGDDLGQFGIPTDSIQMHAAGMTHAQLGAYATQNHVARDDGIRYGSHPEFYQGYQSTHQQHQRLSQDAMKTMGKISAVNEPHVDMVDHFSQQMLKQQYDGEQATQLVASRQTGTTSSQTQGRGMNFPNRGSFQSSGGMLQRPIFESTNRGKSDIKPSNRNETSIFAGSNSLPNGREFSGARANYRTSLGFMSQNDNLRSPFGPTIAGAHDASKSGWQANFNGELPQQMQPFDLKNQIQSSIRAQQQQLQGNMSQYGANAPMPQLGMLFQQQQQVIPRTSEIPFQMALDSSTHHYNNLNVSDNVPTQGFHPCSEGRLSGAHSLPFSGPYAAPVDIIQQIPDQRESNQMQFRVSQQERLSHFSHGLSDPARQEVVSSQPQSKGGKSSHKPPLHNYEPGQNLSSTGRLSAAFTSDQISSDINAHDQKVGRKSTNSASASVIKPQTVGSHAKTPQLDLIKQKLDEHPTSISFQDMLGCATECCKDQQCSRFIQKLLEEQGKQVQQMNSDSNAVDFKQALYDEIMRGEMQLVLQIQNATTDSVTAGTGSSSLMNDPFGNYVIQEMLQYGTPGQRTSFFELILCQVKYLSLQKYGCRIVQRAFDVLEQPQKIQMYEKISKHLLQLMYDDNGNFVVSKIIKVLPKKIVLQVAKMCTGEIFKQSRDKNACRIVQRLLDRFSNEEIRFVIEELKAEVNALTLDEFGNYVLSHVLHVGSDDDKSFIIDKILDDIVQLSLHKFGSNVVEKCLEYSPQHKKELIVDRIVGVPVANHRITLVDLINSQYANYVVQRTFDISNQQRREILLYKIEQVLQSGKLVQNKHSKHVINHLQKQGIDLKVKSETDPDQGVPNEESKHAHHAAASVTQNPPKNEKKRPSHGHNMNRTSEEEKAKSQSSAKAKTKQADQSLDTSERSKEHQQKQQAPKSRKYRQRTKAIMYVPTGKPNQDDKKQ